MRRHTVFGVAACMVLAAGCIAKQSSLLLERHARGPMDEATEVAQGVRLDLNPKTQTQTQGDIDVTVTYASLDYLTDLFRNRKIFGVFAGPNPYFAENLVFYIKVANRSHERIRITPTDFALVDDRNNQYAPINEDYVTALAEARAPFATMTRGLLEGASPGYFGISVPVGRVVATKPIDRFTRIKKSSLQTGYLYPNVVHDGLVAFWNPTKQAALIRLLVTNIKTQFNGNDWPQKSFEFPFEFHVSQ